MEELKTCFQKITRKALECRELLGAESEGVNTQILAQRLSEELEKSDEFSSLVNTVTRTVPRYEKEARESPSKQPFDDILFNTCKGEIGSFLRRSGLYNQAITSGAINPSDYCRRFKDEATKGKCTETKLIVIDGLGSVSTKINDAVHIRQFSKTELDSFFENDVPETSQHVDTACLTDFAFLQIRNQVDVPQVGLLDIFWESMEEKVERAAQPWLNYLNLWSLGTVRASALYEKFDFLLTSPAVRKRTLHEPILIPDAFYIGDGEWIERESPLETVSLSTPEAFVEFVKELGKGRAKALSHGQSLETALRFFSRSCKDLWRWAELHHNDHDLAEDIIINSAIALEALLIGPTEMYKISKKFSSRGAALLSSDDSDIEGIRKEMRRIYEIRSGIAHGGARHSLDDLEKVVRKLRLWVRQTLVALLRMAGEQDRLIKAVDDPDLRHANRKLVPEYEH